jgi:hypothetical protein
VALADELEIEKQVYSAIRCKVCQWVDSLGDEDAASYREWIESGNDLAKLYRACSRIDPPVPSAYSTFSRHVRECR